jgi:SAM-dependent MidA family methyltransferase
MPERLSAPSADAQAASRMLAGLIADRIVAAGGWIPFAEYMDMALYQPGLGYYAGGAHKFGDYQSGGDFVTAPELTPLFGQALARQVAQVLTACAAVASAPTLLEVGAGSGALAADLLAALEGLNALPERYEILELSGSLRARQEALLLARVPHLASRVHWIEHLPEQFVGCVVANELLDALPTHAVAWRSVPAPGLMERGVTWQGDKLTHDLDGEFAFAWAERPATGPLSAAMAELRLELPHIGAHASDYVSEISLAARAWMASWGERLLHGVVLLIDYGLPRHELYHPQRSGGTLRCHYRQRVHDQPLRWPGLADITSHVDFTALAHAGFDAGLAVLGYTSQASFLINCGIGALLAERQQAGGVAALRANGAVQVLLAPAEMGELFKVIAFGRGLEDAGPLLGFAHGDRRHAL